MTNLPTSTQSTTPPPVILWFKVYCVLMAAIYLLLVGVSLFLFVADPGELEMDRAVARLVATAFLVFGLALAGAFLLPFVVAPKPWVWVYGIVLICLGMTSACILPFAIPLLIFWIKDQTKGYYRGYPTSAGL